MTKLKATVAADGPRGGVGRAGVAVVSSPFPSPFSSVLCGALSVTSPWGLSGAWIGNMTTTKHYENSLIPTTTETNCGTFIIVVNQMQNESCRTDAKIVSKEWFNNNYWGAK